MYMKKITLAPHVPIASKLVRSTDKVILTVPGTSHHKIEIADNNGCMRPMYFCQQICLNCCKTHVTSNKRR